MNSPESLISSNRALASVLGRPHSLLEIGCSKGLPWAQVRGEGTRVTGIELDHELARQAEPALDEVRVLDPEADETVERALGERRFELIIIGDVLEKSPRPDELITRFIRHLEPEGRMVISIHNGQPWPAPRRWGHPDCRFPERSSGRNWFTREQAVALLAQAGLEVLRVEHDPMLLNAARQWLSSYRDATQNADGPLSVRWRRTQVYRVVRGSVRFLEGAVTGVLPSWLALQNVVVARRKPVACPLSLTVGMLTMDEEASVGRMIQAIRRHAPDAAILCVDSSVRDRTPEIAQELGARVLRQLPPRGHGPAMELLMYEAARQSEALIYLDCDFTYPPEVIPTVRSILESGADVVNAARTRRRPRAMPWANYAANRTFAWMGRLLGGAETSDLHSGMRGYRTSVIRSFAFDGTGDALPVDTVLWPARCGYRVIEVPIEYQERIGSSKLRKLSGTVWTLIRLGKTLGVGERGGGSYEVWPTLDPGRGVQTTEHANLKR